MPPSAVQRAFHRAGVKGGKATDWHWTATGMTAGEAQRWAGLTYSMSTQGSHRGGLASGEKTTVTTLGGHLEVKCVLCLGV